MTTETLIKTYILEEFFALDLPEDNGPYELIMGEIVPKRKQPAGPSWKHATVIGNLTNLLDDYLAEKDLGRTFPGAACVISVEDGNYFIPDLAYVTPDRVPDDPDISLPYPDLAIEVMSKSDKLFEVRNKAMDYLNARTRLVWVVFWPDKEVYVYSLSGKVTLTEKDALDGGEVIPDFKLPVKKLFE